MLFKGHNDQMLSTLSCYELTELGNIKVKTPCEIALESDREMMNLFEEMFGPDPYNERGQDSAFMDDNFGG
jgi:hypothetical protein